MLMEFREYAAEDFLLDDNFLRYCLGSNEQDIAFWEDWTRKNPDREPVVREARDLLFSLGLRLSPDEKQQEFQKLRLAIRESIKPERIKEEIRKPENTATQINPSTGDQALVVNLSEARERIRPRKWMARVAAAVLFLLAGYGIKSIVGNLRSSGNSPQALVYMIYSTRSGERKTLELADGSSLILNSNSVIKIPSDYNAGGRNLQLSGEAFFEVAKNKDNPFTVSCGKVSVEALGTSFKVRSYTFDKSMRVALVEGSVKVGNGNAQQAPSQILLPGEEVNLDLTGGTVNAPKEKFDINREWGWKEDRLIFKDASLRQIAAELEYWYGLKVNLRIKSHSPVHFNGEFVNKDIDKVLSAITYVNKLNYSLENNEITITSQ